MSIDNLYIYSPSHGPLSFRSVVSSIDAYIKVDVEKEYKIVVGTDSNARDSATLVTAIIVHRVGHGAIYFLARSPVQRFSSLRDRIFEEAMTSIMLAQELRSALKDALSDELLWSGDEIHVDIGKDGPTKDLIDAITGMIKGYNFVPVIKPYAYGAFAVADRHTS